MSAKKSTALAAHDAPEPAVATSILSVIERAASNPAVDVEKMERLLAMHERAKAQQAETAFAEAMNRAQERMSRIAADSHNPQTRSRYASYAALDKALRPIYTAEGFSLSFDTADGDSTDVLRLICYVTHAGGHTRTYHMTMPADGKGAKGGDVMTKTHATGAASTYGMRYLLKMIFNVAIGEDDNDGNAPKSTARRADAAKFDTEAHLLEAAASLDELAATWADIGEEARRALASVKDARKRALQLRGGTAEGV